MKSAAFLLAFLWYAALAIAQQPFFPTLAKDGSDWTYLSTDGQPSLKVNAARFADLRPFYEGLAGAKDKQTGLWGFIDEKGKWKIKPHYETVDDFTDGYAIVSKTCRAECYTGSAGILNTAVAYVIDKKGKVLLTDHSQHEDPMLRYFFDKNLGKGLFRITFGYGFADMKNVINLNGALLCETYSVFGRGDIEYEPALDAFKCQNRFYNVKGTQLLDLSRYAFIGDYSEGYAWATLEEQVSEEELNYWNVLLDKTGKEVLRLNENDYSTPGKVFNGAFSYTDANLEPMQYLLAEQRSIPYILPEQTDLDGRSVEPPNGLDYTYTLTPKQANGTRFFFLEEDQYAGFVSTKGEVFYRLPQEE